MKMIVQPDWLPDWLGDGAITPGPLIVMLSHVCGTSVCLVRSIH
ncbi:MAG: hypothetical protein ACREJB_03470 [Planctomycetaceae bacterium]